MTFFTGRIDVEGLQVKLLEASRSGLLLAAQDVLRRADDLVPVLSGSLESSGKASMESEDTATIEYDSEYAVIQHERTEWHHAQGQAKYLEQPFLSGTDDTVNVIADHVREQLAL